jgi:branched-chain amino acid transport system ATP-binding protein
MLPTMGRKVQETLMTDQLTATGAVVSLSPAASDDVILETQGLGRDFKGFTAVGEVSIHVKRGAIHALIGPNGAGKTTFFNLLTHFLDPSRGRIVFNGRDITNLPPERVAQLGIVRSFQVSAIFPRLTVLQNVRMALQRKDGLSLRFWESSQRLQALNDRAMALLAQVRLETVAESIAGEIAYGQRRALELITTMALEPELVLLDEPTQGMGAEDVDRTMALVKQLAQHRTVIMVEHNMKVVAGISDRITVLAQGSVLAEGTYAEVSTNTAVVDAYMGRRAKHGSNSSTAGASA